MIFGIGLSKTGTQSLAEVLTILGYPCIHYPSAELMLAGEYDRAFGASLAACDITVSAFYKQLDRAYPESLFILTTREMNKWLESVEAHMSYVLENAPHEHADGHPKGAVRELCFSTRGYSEEMYRQAYLDHLSGVQSYFASQNDRLLIVDLTNGDGWEPICSFLGRDIPREPFPHKNKRVSV
jgi:hypothetical protein